MLIAYIKEILRTSSRTLIILLALILLNIVLSLLLNFYQKPQLQSLQNEWFNRRNASGSLLDRGTAFELGSADIQKWRSIISPKKDLARIVSEIHEIARSNSLNLMSISYKPEHLKSEKLLTYNLGLSVNGKYSSLKSFISDIGRLRDIVTLDQISLNNPKLTEEMVSLRLNITVYLKLEGQ